MWLCMVSNFHTILVCELNLLICLDPIAYIEECSVEIILDKSVHDSVCRILSALCACAIVKWDSYQLLAWKVLSLVNLNVCLSLSLCRLIPAVVIPAVVLLLLWLSPWLLLILLLWLTAAFADSELGYVSLTAALPTFNVECNFCQVTDVPACVLPSLEVIWYSDSTGCSLLLTNAEVLLECTCIAKDCRTCMIELEDIVLSTVDSNCLSTAVSARTPVYPVLNDVVLYKRILHPAVYAETWVTLWACWVFSCVVHYDITVLSSLLGCIVVSATTSEEVTTRNLCAPICAECTAAAESHRTASTCVIKPDLVAVAVNVISLVLIHAVANAELLTVCSTCLLLWLIPVVLLLVVILLLWLVPVLLLILLLVVVIVVPLTPLIIWLEALREILSLIEEVSLDSVSILTCYTWTCLIYVRIPTWLIVHLVLAGVGDRLLDVYWVSDIYLTVVVSIAPCRNLWVPAVILAPVVPCVPAVVVPVIVVPVEVIPVVPPLLLLVLLLLWLIPVLLLIVVLLLWLVPVLLLIVVLILLLSIIVLICRSWCAACKCNYLVVSRLWLVALWEEKRILWRSPAYVILCTPDGYCRDLSWVLHSELEDALIEACLCWEVWASDIELSDLNFKTCAEELLECCLVCLCIRILCIEVRLHTDTVDNAELLELHSHVVDIVCLSRDVLVIIVDVELAVCRSILSCILECLDYEAVITVNSYPVRVVCWS